MGQCGYSESSRKRCFLGSSGHPTEQLPQMLGTSLESNMFSLEPPRVYHLPNIKLMAGLPPCVGPNPYIKYITYHIDNIIYIYICVCVQFQSL